MEHDNSKATLAETLCRANDKTARPLRAATHAKNAFGVRLFKG
jgi:hypothetical protein